MAWDVESEQPEYHGEFVNFDPIHSYPKPVQKPLPVLMGAHGFRGLRRVVRYCNGWMPVEAAVRDPKKDIQNLRNLAEQSGRDPASFDVTMTLARADPKANERAICEAGVNRVVFGPAVGQADTACAETDRTPR